jgi:beta-lactam-binding protein with PASTA domain
MALDTGGNVRVDRIWGNMPMQPDEARLDDANSTDVLDPDLGDHVIAVESYNGFPGYTPVAPYLDTIENVVVPDVVGDTLGDAQTAIEADLFVYAAGASTFVGATTVNTGKVKSQSPAAGAVANLGDTVTVIAYNAPEVPDLDGMTEAEADAALIAVGLISGTVGAEAGLLDTVVSQSVAAGVTVNAGSAVNYNLGNTP